MTEPKMPGLIKLASLCLVVQLYIESGRVHLLLAGLFARVVRGFEIGADLVEGEPGGFELSACVERSLVHVVSTPGISACTEGVDRKCANLWPKIDHTDIRPTCNAVASFLPADRRGVKSENSAIIAIQ